MVSTVTCEAATTTGATINNEKDQVPASHSTRRAFVSSSFASAAALALTPLSAQAKKPPPMSVGKAASAVRFELQDAAGSLGRLQAALDAQDFTLLMETTKTMDQSLRKQIVGQAKYYWEDQSAGTQLSNNITFDLIGINRNARPGQENAEGVQKYLNELQQDLKAILLKTEEAAGTAST